uniref:Putative glycoprotein n=1 Tax=Bolahun virus variant 1 TaxID=1903426 RepID=A0A1C9U5C1_9VIRU|nr:putative glycoprotein [Bolahun virus variant 1]
MDMALQQGNEYYISDDDSDGGPDLFIPISQVDTLREMGFLPVSYGHYSKIKKNFLNEFYMAWAMAGTYSAIVKINPSLSALDILSDIEIERVGSCTMSDEGIIGCILLDDPRAINTFKDLCSGRGLFEIVADHYSEVNMHEVSSMAPFCKDKNDAKSWTNWALTSGCRPNSVKINFEPLESINNFTVIMEIRAKLDLVSGTSFDLDVLDKGKVCSPVDIRPKANVSEVQEVPSTSYLPSAPSPSVTQPVVQNRKITNNDFQKEFVPTGHVTEVESFFNYIMEVRVSPSTLGCGLMKYSPEFIWSFALSNCVQGRAPSWARNAPVLELISRLNDYCIHSIKDEGMYSREMLGTKTYIDSSTLNETMESLKSSQKRESKAILNVESMMKELLAHIKSGERSITMAALPTVSAEDKPLFEAEGQRNPQVTKEPTGIIFIPPPPV